MDDFIKQRFNEEQQISDTDEESQDAYFRAPDSLDSFNYEDENAQNILAIRKPRK